MRGYSKAIAAIIAGLVSLATAAGLDLGLLEDPATQAALVGLVVSVLAVYVAPANSNSGEIR